MIDTTLVTNTEQGIKELATDRKKKAINKKRIKQSSKRDIPENKTPYRASIVPN